MVWGPTGGERERERGGRGGLVQGGPPPPFLAGCPAVNKPTGQALGLVLLDVQHGLLIYLNRDVPYV